MHSAGLSLSSRSEKFLDTLSPLLLSYLLQVVWSCGIMGKTIKEWQGGIKQRMKRLAAMAPSSSAAASSSAEPPQTPSQGQQRKVGRPKRYTKRGTVAGRVLRQRLRTKWLKNQASAKDVVEDAIASWTAGADAE